MRVLIKISGEALGNDGIGINVNALVYLAQELKTILRQKKVQVGLIIGGGNFMRGINASQLGFEQVTVDQMGMLGTVLNALAIREIFEKYAIATELMSAIPIGNLVVFYDQHLANQSLNAGKILLLAGGTGNPLVTTDSALSLRGIELKADLLLKATNVDGVYSEDPRKNPKAIFYKKLSYGEVLTKKLKVMDELAFMQCRDYNIPLRVFNFQKKGALQKILSGKEEGTLITN